MVSVPLIMTNRNINIRIGFTDVGGLKNNQRSVFSHTCYMPKFTWKCSQVTLWSLHVGSAAAVTIPLSTSLTRWTPNITLASYTHKRQRHHCSFEDSVIVGINADPGSQSSRVPAGCSSRLYRWSRFHCKYWVYSSTDLFPVRRQTFWMWAWQHETCIICLVW